MTSNAILSLSVANLTRLQTPLAQLDTHGSERPAESRIEDAA